MNSTYSIKVFIIVAVMAFLKFEYIIMFQYITQVALFSTLSYLYEQLSVIYSLSFKLIKKIL